MELNFRFRLSHIRFSIFPVTGHQRVDRYVYRQQTALHITLTRLSPHRVIVRLVGRSVGRGDGVHRVLTLR